MMCSRHSTSQAGNSSYLLLFWNPERENTLKVGRVEESKDYLLWCGL
jgi:uncharacterized protein YchJ